MEAKALKQAKKSNIAIASANGNGKKPATDERDARNSVPQEAFVAMLEASPINVMMANLDGVIVYANQKTIDTFKQLEKYIPVKAHEVVGSTYDIFHKDPSLQRRILSNPKNLPHKTVFNLGPEKVELVANAVYDSHGSYIGPMVAWAVVTEKLKLEDEIAQIQSMMECMPINTMVCGLDFVINYMNPKSKETFKIIEQHLPVSADKVLGSSIDVFHKSPAKNRKIVSDPRNLPHRAKIRVGPETLDLLVSPIYNKSKDYIGAMVTWGVITKQIELQNALEQTAQQLASAAEELTAVASQMKKNSEMTSEKSNTAAANAEQVGRGVESVATNTEEMVASVKEISKSSADAAEISRSAMKRAQETNATIKQLGEASQQVGNVIKVISSIAQQTNLLALNATIEAARAGDAGKGFAVVANEVKELAKQTANATEDITQRISAIQESSRGAVEAIASIGEIIEKINSISITIAAAVEEQTATTNEVSKIMQDSSSSVSGITDIVRTVAAAAHESEAGAGQSLEAATGLARLAAQLRELVKKIEV